MQQQKPLPQQRTELIKFAETAAEKRLAIADSEKKLYDYDWHDTTILIETIGKWAYYLGVGKKLSGDDILLHCNFLKQEYPSLSASEIDIAAKMALTDSNLQFFGEFAPLYMCQVINNYIEYKNRKLESVRQRMIIHREETKPPPTAEEKKQIFLECLTYEIQKYQDQKVVEDYFSFVYDHFKKTGRLMQEQKEEAEQYALNQLMLIQQGEARTMTGLLRKSFTKGHLEKNFYVQQYFAEKSQEEIINSIQIGEFN